MLYKIYYMPIEYTVVRFTLHIVLHCAPADEKEQSVKELN